MLIDKLLLLSDEQALSATGVSANTVDLLAANSMMGDGNPVGIASMWTSRPLAPAPMSSS